MPPSVLVPAKETVSYFHSTLLVMNCSLIHIFIPNGHKNCGIHTHTHVNVYVYVYIIIHTCISISTYIFFFLQFLYYACQNHRTNPAMPNKPYPPTIANPSVHVLVPQGVVLGPSDIQLVAEGHVKAHDGGDIWYLDCHGCYGYAVDADDVIYPHTPRIYVYIPHL